MLVKYPFQTQKLKYTMSLLTRIRENPSFYEVCSILFFALLGCLLGGALTKFNPFAVAVILFLPAAVRLLSLKPEWGILGIFLLTSSVDFFQLPYFSFGFGSFHISDMILLCLLGLVILKRLGNGASARIRTPLDLPLMLFLGAAVVSFYTAFFTHSVPANDALKQFRALSYYALFFVVTVLIQDRRRIRFLFYCLLSIAGITSVAIILNSFFNISFFGHEMELQGDATISRVIPPGFRIMYYAFFTILVLLLKGPTKREKLLLVPLLILISSGFFLSFNRTSWISLSLSSAILLLLIPFRKKLEVMVTSGAIMISCIVVFYVFPPQTYFDKYAKAISERGASIFEGRELGTLQYREEERFYALGKIEKSPILGIGLGNSYRPPFWEGDEITWFIHNSYLGILLDMGLLGFVPFLMLSFKHLWRGFRNWKKIEDRFLSCLCLGITVAYFGTMLSSFTESAHFGGWTVAIYGVTWGINEIIYRQSIDHQLHRRTGNGACLNKNAS